MTIEEVKQELKQMSTTLKQMKKRRWVDREGVKALTERIESQRVTLKELERDAAITFLEDRNDYEGDV
jgi:hypothetical protein